MVTWALVLAAGNILVSGSMIPSKCSEHNERCPLSARYMRDLAQERLTPRPPVTPEMFIPC
jgi:hypothetical protein